MKTRKSGQRAPELITISSDSDDEEDPPNESPEESPSRGYSPLRPNLSTTLPDSRYDSDEPGHLQKRRKSSPMLDPIPNYSQACSPQPPVPITTTTTTTVNRTYYTRNNRIPNSASAVRPVSGELAKAVARRRSNSGLDNPASNLLQKTTTMTKTTAIATTKITQKTPNTTNATPQKDAGESQYWHAEKPVMWSPRLPSQISPAKPLPLSQPTTEMAPTAKKRIAHKPTVQQNKSAQPRRPLGVAKNVPLIFRTKYLNVIINEYLNTGHPEQQSYDEALKEEGSLAMRAANKSIYINLVAGLKKRIRDKAGISTIPPDDDPRETSNGNKVVSHNDIITGKVTGTFSIERKRKGSDPSQLNETELYDMLMRYLVPIDQLEAYSYPQQNPDEPTQRLPPLGKSNQRQQLRAQLATTYTCERCTKVYRVDEFGVPLPDTGKCIYHPGHLWNERINRSLEKRYSCCKNDASDLGCSSNEYHVHKGELELANYEGYVETRPKPEKDPNKHGIYALDCELCYTTIGLELTRVTVINHKMDVVYEQFVKPNNQILDYNTRFSGIKEGDLTNVKKTLIDVQRDLLNLFSTKTILVGHSLDSDMKALKLFHKRFIDTAQLFPHKRGLPFKRALKTLMVENLKTIIQDDAGHDSKEDASAALKLVLWKAKTDVPVKST